MNIQFKQTKALRSLVMPIGDPQDGFSYPTLTLMIDPYYNLTLVFLPRLSRVDCSLVVLELAHIVVK